VRAALRVRAWPDVLVGIAALPESEQQAPAWRYWKARALAAAGRGEEANALYATLARDVGYYGLLGAEAQGRGPQYLAALRSVPLGAEPALVAAFGRRADVRRVQKLLDLDLRAEALREWSYVTRGQTDEALLLASEWARGVALYDRAINAAERTVARHDFALRYQTPFEGDFRAAARDQGVDEALLYGIARQESRFVPDIVSAAGAVGLMQLMPGTARWVAGKMARTDFKPAQITSPPLNTQFGAFYFRYWHDRLDQRPALAAAAYNAGPSRAQSWRPAGGSLEGALWVETIPFNETRDYVKKVLANTVLYAHALKLPYVSLTDRLGVITARETADLAAKSP
jgi:soluble lytic murein transglycosylase